MKKTKDRETDKLLFVDVEKMAAMLSCGQATAKKWYNIIISKAMHNNP